MANLIVFCILAVVIIGSALFSVYTKRIMRAATTLLFVLFGIAGIYFLLDYTFIGAAQIAVYAGGITMMYIFAIAIMPGNTLQGMVERFHGTRIVQGALAALAGLATLFLVFFKTKMLQEVKFTTLADLEIPMQTVGEALVGSEKYQYVLPFEFISIFLLACIIGGIVIARKEDNK